MNTAYRMPAFFVRLCVFSTHPYFEKTNLFKFFKIEGGTVLPLMACKVSLQSLLATLIAISVANNGNDSAQVAGRCIAYVRPATRIPSALLHVVPMPAWEQRKFSNLTDRVSMQSSDPDLPQVEYEDIVSDEGTLNKDLRDKEGGKTGIKFYAGDVLYGKLRPYLMNWLYPQFNGVAVGDFWVLRATECDSSFLYRLVQTDSFQRLANVSSGSKMPRADWNLISQSFFAVPADYAEQRVIAKSLAELDNLITLHQRKYDKLVILKKSMLEKMFPKDGESVPEIRFAGFTDPWEQRKFSEIVDVCSGRDYKHLDEGPIPVYGTGGYMTSVSEALSHNRDAIGIGRKGTIDKPYLLKAPFWTVDTLFYAIPKSDINLEFALCSFLNVDWKSKDESTGLPSLSKESINETVLSVPNVVEQNHLGNFFADLDRLITLHQRKLELLQNIKKSLLDKMFV